MNVTEKQIKIARTKSGTPCLWESYTEFDDLKRAIVIVGKDGNIKNSIFVRQYGSKQSLIPIAEGDYVVKIFNDAQGRSVSVLEIKTISNTSNQAEMLLKYRESNDETQGTFDESYNEGIKAAENKMADAKFIASQLFEKHTAQE